MPRRETSAEIDEIAAEWALRCDDAALSDGEQAELDRWLEGDVRRVGAFARAQAVLIHAKRAKALGSSFDPESYAAEGSDVREAYEEEVEEAPAANSILSRRRMLIGASALAASGAVAFFIPSRPAHATVFETARGETRLIPFEDGSTVMLNTASKITVSTKDAARIIRLDHGEALFNVVHAEQMPIRVDVDDAALFAKSAKFVVCRLDRQPVEIKVCEGNVAFRRNAFSSGGSHELAANMRATLSPEGTMIERNIAPETIERELAWQSGMLSFEDTRLSRAAEQFARYSNKQIVIEDPAVAAETVTGIYAANDPEGFARAVALGLELRARSTPNGIALER